MHAEGASVLSVDRTSGHGIYNRRRCEGTDAAFLRNMHLFPFVAAPLDVCCGN